MHAGVYDFAFLLNEMRLEIPLFQREYHWNETNWRRFFTELKHAFDHNSAHFLGTLLLKTVPNRFEEPPFRLLLDGEQRVTTFAILLKALFDQLDPKEDSDLIDNLKNILFESIENRTPKICHSRENKQAFGIIFNVEKASDILKDKNNQKPIIECYRYFTKCAQECEHFYFRHFLNYLLNAKIWVILDLEETDNAQIVFDTVNFVQKDTNGARMFLDSVNFIQRNSAAAQIIQNNLFYRVIEIVGEYDFEQFYKDYWHAIFEKDEESIAFWQSDDLRGYPQIEGFLKVFATICGFFNPDEHVFNDLSAEYKNKMSRISNKEEMQEFLNSFKEFALLWQEWGILGLSGRAFENFECRLFQIVHLTELSLLPLILKLKYILKDNGEELKNVFDFLAGVLCQTYINKSMIPSTNAEYFEIMKNLDENAPLEFLKNHFANKRKTQPAKKIVKRVVRK